MHETLAFIAALAFCDSPSDWRPKWRRSGPGRWLETLSPSAAQSVSFLFWFWVPRSPWDWKRPPSYWGQPWPRNGFQAVTLLPDDNVNATELTQLPSLQRKPTRNCHTWIGAAFPKFSFTFNPATWMSPSRLSRWHIPGRPVTVQHPPTSACYH